MTETDEVHSIEDELIHCPNCNGMGFVSYNRDGNKEDYPDHLLVCSDCGLILENNWSEDVTSKRTWLEAEGDFNASGCPVCGQ